MIGVNGAFDASEKYKDDQIRYSICTLVTKPDEYAEMVSSFQGGGFIEPECEFLYLDNSEGNNHEAFGGYNLFLNTARGEYIILCHQDILLLEDGREKLDNLLTDLTAQHPDWAVAGNAGVRPNGDFAIRITDPLGENTNLGPFPAEVWALDENFVVVRRSANLAVSRDLEGFHLYCTDLCITARTLGHKAFVIDFHLHHKSPGGMNDHFRRVEKALIEKYRDAWRPRYITTNCTFFFLSGWNWLSKLGNNRFIKRRILSRRKKR